MAKCGAYSNVSPETPLTLLMDIKRLYCANDEPRVAQMTHHEHSNAQSVESIDARAKATILNMLRCKTDQNVFWRRELMLRLSQRFTARPERIDTFLGVKIRLLLQRDTICVYITTLRINLYDENLLFDDLIQSIGVDISTLTKERMEVTEFAVQPQKEVLSYWKLNVTVIKAQTRSSNDYFSESDLYVVLCLPTASASAFKTKTVYNDANPEWNETFTFRVPSQLKNVLELHVHDEDPVSHDDRISTVLFDLSKLTLGKKERMAFNLNPETMDQIWIEFEMLRSEEPQCDYVSNGILLAAPFSALDITVDELLRNNDDFLGTTIMLGGACPPNQRLLAKDTGKLHFYINRDLATELGVAPSAVEHPSISTRLQPLPAEHTSKVSLVIDQDTVDFNVETHECADDHIALRLDFDIPPQEKEFLKKRKLIVGQNMQKLFGLDTPPSPDQVPTIALVASGGGSRAMTSLFGTLKSLKEIKVLDVLSYITGVSGATWTMAALFRDANWSQDGIDGTVAQIRKEICKDATSMISLEKMEYYKREMEAKLKEGHILSSTDLGGLLYEHLVFGEKMTDTLSEHQRAVDEGQNPFPIYTAVNMKEKMGWQSEAEWCEFTPYEVGFPKYGAFVPAQDFGSQFFLGHLVKKLPEVRLPFLIGIWSSFFAINLSYLLELPTEESSREADNNTSNLEVENDPSILDTQLLDPSGAISRIINDCLMNRPLGSIAYNFMNGLFLHSDYSTHSNFVAWKETHPDAFPNSLTPSDSFLRLVDSGLAINVACPPVLRPEREVDVIICCDNSWNPVESFREIKLTAAWCRDRDVPFPRVDFTTLEGEPLKEIYIYEDKKNPKAPIVIHFPLVNDSFRHFKEPGVKRETAEEIKAGEVDVRSSDSPYTTDKPVYSEGDFDSLLKLTAYNVANNKERIVQTLHQVLKSKMNITQAM
ncbi:cytosolic phospholipase A2 beta-like isoform X2 [Syngnathus scovelli]|uniref:cytosolic phospholipase A2 beta-like isoform X2 n=1 Tax=Syngnathus scovelli TaxID=161590 RepID=UPI0021103209|nr:cytosolic phospholipase A2 beta-like isoform X2 [Syngnathus scovelli]